MNVEHQATQALEAAARRRRELRDALMALEDTVASSVHDADRWRRLVAARITALGEAFAEHVAETEAPGGLYDEMEEVAPHMQGKARRLREEHPPLTRAIAEAGAGDVVLLAGKGHEQGQIVGTQILPFDDVQVARECAA